MLRQKLRKKRISLNDDQRRRLAVKGKILGRNVLEQLATIVTPDTILRWHRELTERNHQGIGNRLITPREELGRTTGVIECRERLGGTLRYYYRKAA